MQSEQSNQDITIKGTSFTNNKIQLTAVTQFPWKIKHPDSQKITMNFHRVIMSNVTCTNCKSTIAGGAFYLIAANNKTEIVAESALSLNNSSPAAPGRAVHIIMPWDTLEDPGCTHKDRPTAKRKEENKFPKWDYNSKLLFKDTRFKYNTALIGGALYLNH